MFITNKNLKSAPIQYYFSHKVIFQRNKCGCRLSRAQLAVVHKNGQSAMRLSHLGEERQVGLGRQRNVLIARENKGRGNGWREVGCLR